MNKQQFLNELRNYLEGEVPQSIINENIAYYDGYFDEQHVLGKTDEEIIEQIGGPTIIAHTIVDSAQDITGSSYGGETIYTEDGDEANDSPLQEDSPFHLVTLKWYHKVLALAVVVGVIALLFTLAGAVVSFAGPLLLILLIFYFIRRLF